MKNFQPILALLFVLASLFNCAAQPAYRIASIVFTHLQPNGPDTISWSADRVLQPDDFTGSIPEREKKSDLLGAAATSFSFIINGHYDTSGYRMNICTGTFHYKSSSWIKTKGKLNDNTLAFEQMKFDLTKVYEIKFRKYLRDTTFTIDNIYERCNKIYYAAHAEYTDEMDRMYKDCRNVNRNIFSKKKFLEWKNKIAVELKNYLTCDNSFD